MERNQNKQRKRNEIFKKNKQILIGKHTLKNKKDSEVGLTTRHGEAEWRFWLGCIVERL